MVVSSKFSRERVFRQTNCLSLKPPEDAKIVCEEVFGPVANVNVFYTEKEVVEKINSVEFGPYAVMFTINID